MLKGRKLRSAYREVFRGPQGELVLADLVEQGGMMRVNYTQADSHHTAFLEGARGLVIRVFQMLDKDESHLRELEQRRKKVVNRQEMEDE